MRITQRLTTMMLAVLFFAGLSDGGLNLASCAEVQGKTEGQKAAAVEAAVARQTDQKPNPRPTSKARKKKIKGNTAKKAKDDDTSNAVATQNKPKRHRHSKKSLGRCEPQSLTYARQRSGIMRSRTGPENGPLTWFASEKKLGMTSVEPEPGSVLILGAHKGHGMPTGHVAYVEQADLDSPARYRIVFSHTNYDRKCSLETNIEAYYDSTAHTLDIFSGAWKSWGQGLKVAGFILKE